MPDCKPCPASRQRVRLSEREALADNSGWDTGLGRVAASTMFLAAARNGLELSPTLDGIVLSFTFGVAVFSGIILGLASVADIRGHCPQPATKQVNYFQRFCASCSLLVQTGFSPA